MESDEDYQRFWDGTESGWGLCRYKQTVWLAEYFFGDSGPTDREFTELIQFVPPWPGESADEMRERMRDCQGCAIGRPIGATELRGLKSS